MGAAGSSRVLVARIAQGVMAACPAGWQRAQVRYRQVGARLEYDGAAVDADGGELPVTVPDDVAELFGELRRQHGAETGPWFSARVRVAHPDRFALDTDVEEPQFRQAAPELADYVADAAALPWPDATRPAWLRELLDAEGVAEQGRRALRSLGASPAAIAFGSTPAGESGWVVRRDSGAWWAGRAAEPPLGFPDARAAAAYAVGQVALSLPAEEVVDADGRIDALPGDPPLSLFQDLRRLRLQPGTLLDRLGRAEGNVTYLAGTPLPMRSLPPELVRQSSTVYRVCRPVEALFGEAIAWFGQPGGGTACVLPRSVRELLAAGVLVPEVAA